MPCLAHPFPTARGLGWLQLPDWPSQFEKRLRPTAINVNRSRPRKRPRSLVATQAPGKRLFLPHPGRRYDQCQQQRLFSSEPAITIPGHSVPDYRIAPRSLGSRCRQRMRRQPGRRLKRLSPALAEPASVGVPNDRGRRRNCPYHRRLRHRSRKPARRSGATPRNGPIARARASRLSCRPRFLAGTARKKRPLLERNRGNRARNADKRCSVRCRRPPGCCGG